MDQSVWVAGGRAPVSTNQRKAAFGGTSWRVRSLKATQLAISLPLERWPAAHDNPIQTPQRAHSTADTAVEELVMDFNPSRPADVAVVLTPTQAKRIADAIRIELASQWDTAWFTSLPCREDVGKARSLLDVYSDQLEELEWGEAARSVELHSRRDRLEYLEVILTEGAAECLADSDSSHDGARRAKMQGQDMIAAADAIHQALHQHARSATA